MADEIPVAGNGLLHRRLFLKGGAVAAAGLLTARPAAAQASRPPWGQSPGAGMSPYGARSPNESHVNRVGIGSQQGTDGSGASRTPLELLQGTITPAALHFERHHSGVPAIDPRRHELYLHGLVRRPLKFSMEDLLRYPMTSTIQFLECSGNSGALIAPTPPVRTCAELHGLVSGSEWSGVPLSVLLDEAGVTSEAKWFVAEGADAASMVRSVPLEKGFDDALIALYQNGERLRPENGYPVRLFLPGFEGNASVKWLKRIVLTAEPAMAKDETSKYSDLMPDGRAKLFTFQMGVKSVITAPSGGLVLDRAGLYQITGLAWSGAGKIKRVEVSADGGRSWAQAHLEGTALPKALTRFRAPWRWNGAPAVLKSRATDETGAVQPSREAWLAQHGGRSFYHFNAIQPWAVAADGTIANVYA